ncbi:hypothetical protein CC78DRAFT_86994 [Lojkania enalia]|uniref:Uncharacterized protein n=1 Tax=Lojkania enalia TaxID=147567 RepID=A0A9P4N7T3_9PLEO|nr:hypothetical protein CC78DRAFT_86994 [Didymosphaeria enalia]
MFGLLGALFFDCGQDIRPFQVMKSHPPADLMRIVIRTISTPPCSWENMLFDYDGKPTTNPAEGRPLGIWGVNRSIKDLIYKIWDQPKSGIVNTGAVREEQRFINTAKTKPYPPSFSEMFWKPSAIRIDNVFLHGYDDQTDELLEAMPKIFVYNPVDRITARTCYIIPGFP